MEQSDLDHSPDDRTVWCIPRYVLEWLPNGSESKAERLGGVFTGLEFVGGYLVALLRLGEESHAAASDRVVWTEFLQLEREQAEMAEPKPLELYYSYRRGGLGAYRICLHLVDGDGEEPISTAEAVSLN